uniref:FPL domain-containing protein n=1 Tax=Rhizophora mucronata TaxID=61149 RepID=A0A2P2KZQ1_RHIMU
MFSNEHINFLITYAFDFRNEELLSYYISFVRAISGKLNKNTISLLVKTQNKSFLFHCISRQYVLLSMKRIWFVLQYVL